MEINDTEHELLVFMGKGGVVALRVYGKKVTTMETACSPKFYAGLKQLERLEDAGLVRCGDPSPYKNGKSYPYVLTDAGRAVLK